MKTRIKYAALITALLLAAASLAACSAPAGESRAEESAAASGEDNAPAAALTDAAYDAGSATMITCEGDSITVEGDGASADGGVVRITAGGTYILTGALDGHVEIEAPSTDKVRLVLDGATITAREHAAIYCAQADRLTLTLAEGSENTVSDAVDYAYADVTAEEPDAAIFCKDDLTINGAGALTVNASFNNGIGSKDDLVIEGGTYRITAANHGLRGRDSVTVLDGVLTIEAGNDGIQSNNDEDAEKGWISLEGGVYDITSANDGVQAETALTISGGEFTILAGGGSAATPADAAGSYKGLKAGTDLAVTGGSFAIDSADDALHANGDIALSGGTMEIATGDDAAHADGHLELGGGEINVTKCFEGFEAFTMTISDGTVSIVASDDGINIAGGNDADTGGRFGPDAFASNGDRWLDIRGGSVAIDAGGDGFDANGDITMSGGEVIVSGSANDGNSALDYDGTFDITGGTLLTSGMTGMAQAPGESSAQPSLAVVFSARQAAGAVVAVTAEDGSAAAEFSAAKDFQCIIVSAPALSDGGTYAVSVDGAKLLDVTLSGAVTAVTDSGEAATLSGRMGGWPGGGGGMSGGMRSGGGTPGEPPALPAE